MKRFLLLVCSGMLFLAASAQRTVINDPNAELRPVAGFHGIRVSNAIDVFLTQGDKETVAVSASEDRWRDRIRTEVVDGILHIYVENKKGITFSTGNKKMKAYVAYTKLDKLDASGASDIYVDGVIAGESLEISLSGSSDFKGAVKVGSLKLDQSGSSDAYITGTVAGLTTISSNGASDVKAYELTTETCTVNASGASDVRITINKELNAHASGASSIYYKGNAVIRDLHSSGASSVSKKG